MVLVFATPRRDYTGAVEILLDLPDLLEARRADLGWTQSQQARSMGITRSTMTNLMAGRTPSYATILSALRWLNAHGG